MARKSAIAAGRALALRVLLAAALLPAALSFRAVGPLQRGAASPHLKRQFREWLTAFARRDALAAARTSAEAPPCIENALHPSLAGVALERLGSTHGAAAMDGQAWPHPPPEETLRRLGISVGAPGLPAEDYADDARTAWQLASDAAEDLALREHPLRHWALAEAADVLGAFRRSAGRWMDGAAEADAGPMSSAALGTQVAASDAVLGAREMFLRLGLSEDLEAARAHVEAQLGRGAIPEETWGRLFAGLASAKHGEQLDRVLRALGEVMDVVERGAPLDRAAWQGLLDRLDRALAWARGWGRGR